MKSQTVVMIGTAVILLLFIPYTCSFYQECSAANGTMVEGAFGWACVEDARDGKR